MKKIGLTHIKQALMDGRFRDKLPIEMQESVAKFLSNPTCACNLPLYREILKNNKSLLEEYFPGKIIETEEEKIQTLAKNNWSVINCNIKDLQKELRGLPPGRKQLAVTRFEDQVTVVVNEIEEVY